MSHTPPPIGTRVITRKSKDVGPGFRGLTGTIVDHVTVGDHGFVYINFDEPPHPRSTLGSAWQGGTWSPGSYDVVETLATTGRPTVTLTKGTNIFAAVDSPRLRMPEEHMPLPTAITLFSGLGSSSKAARDLGHTVLAHDFMREACSSLVANGFPVIQGDIRAVDFTDLIYRNVRLIVGGPPCQPFSQGGRNAGENDPRDMIPDFQRAVAQILPETFILENVRGLAGPRHRAYLDRRVAEFEAMGYMVDWRIVDAADHGVAQSRKRLIIIGRRLDTTPWTAATWPEKQPQQTMAEALDWTAKDCVSRNLLAPVPARDSVACFWPMARPSVTVVGSFMPEVMAAPGYRSTGDGPRQNAPGSVVTTPEERLVLQGMPRDWKVLGSKSKRDLQIGNSCPNPLLVALIRANMNLA